MLKIKRPNGDIVEYPYTIEPKKSGDEFLPNMDKYQELLGDKKINIFAEDFIKHQAMGRTIIVNHNGGWCFLTADDVVVEFVIGDTVTLDRYNHIDDVEVVKVVGYGSMGLSDRLTYEMDVNGTIISSTGGSIMESKLYEPVPEEDRHYKKGASVTEIEKYWENLRNKSKN